MGTELDIRRDLATGLRYRHGTWDYDIITRRHEIDRIIEPGCVLLDLGANIGTRAWQALQLGAARVTCYEPRADNFGLLEANLGGYQGVTLVQAAVVGAQALLDADKLGEVDLWFRNPFFTGAATVIKKSWHERSERVPATSFRVAVSNGYHDTIKCDVEGAEYDYEWEALPDTVKTILLEFHYLQIPGAVGNAKQVDQILRGDLGFTCMERVLSEPFAADTSQHVYRR